MRPTVVLLVLLAACETTTNLPVDVETYEEAEAVCAEAEDAASCRDLSTTTYDCGAVVSGPCETDPYDAPEWRFDGCVPTQTTCTQFTVWLDTDEGCRAFDACYAPDDLEPCDPEIECPT